MRSLTIFLCILLLAAVAGGPVNAQTYPTKTIRMVVAFSAGTVTDIMTRAIASELTERLGQPVVVENRPGAGGNIGCEAVKNAAPDGYTLLAGSNGPLAANVSLYSKLPFDPIKDFSPIVVVTRGSMFLVANQSVSAESVTDVIQMAKARPGTLSFGASSTTGRVWVELLKIMAGIDVVCVPYKEVGNMFANLMGGKIPFAFENTGPCMPYIQANKIKAIAVTHSKRSGTAPLIPTLAEFGLGRYNLRSWMGYLAPKGTPAEIIVRINAEVNKIVHESPKIKQLLANLDLDTEKLSPEQFAEFIKADIANWAEIVKLTGVRLD